MLSLVVEMLALESKANVIYRLVQVTGVLLAGNVQQAGVHGMLLLQPSALVVGVVKGALLEANVQQ